MNDEPIPLSSFRMRSEELLLIQNDLAHIQDGLDTVVHENISRYSFLNKASRTFFNFLKKLYDRGEVLQEYAQSLMKHELDLDRAQKDFNSVLIDLRILKNEIPAEQEKLDDAIKKLNDIHNRLKKNQMKMQKYKQSINIMASQHNTLADQITRVHLGITDNLYDDMSDVNVNVFIEVQNLKSDIKKTENKIEESKAQIEQYKNRMEILNQNSDEIVKLQILVEHVRSLYNAINQTTKLTKEVRSKQRQERINSLQFSTNITQITNQYDQIRKDIKVHRSFRATLPYIHIDVKNSEQNFKEMHDNLIMQLTDLKTKEKNNKEIETRLTDELNSINEEINELDSQYDYLETNIAIADIHLEDLNKQKNKEISELELISRDFQKLSVENALLNFRLMNHEPLDVLLQEEKEKNLNNYAQLSLDINKVNFEYGDLLLKIEEEIMKINVLEADTNRVSFYINTIDHNQNEDETSCQILKEKSERKKHLNDHLDYIKRLEDTVSLLKTRTQLKSSSISKRKQIYEESISKWTQQTIHSQSLSASFQNGSPIKQTSKRLSLLSAHAKQLSDAFQAQASFWKENNNSAQYRNDLVDWAMQVDQVNNKILTSPAVKKHGLNVRNNENEYNSLSYSDL